jgi:hypothetical protein
MAGLNIRIAADNVAFGIDVRENEFMQAEEY